MTTASQAFAAVKARIEAGALGVPLRWQNEEKDSDGNAELADTPEAFIYSEFIGDRASVIEIGGGRGSNRHRNPAHLDIYVFVPRGGGLAAATDIAEQIAALFRPLHSGGVNVDRVSVSPGGDGADLKPKGMPSLVDNYYYATVQVELYYDLVG